MRGGIVGGAYEGDIAVQDVCRDTTAGQTLNRKCDRYAGCSVSGLEIMSLTSAFQTNRCGESLKRQTQFFAKRLDVHTREFAQSEQTCNLDVRTVRDDTLPARSHNAIMAKTHQDPDRYDDQRAKSGWYLGAWRAFRKMTLQELATSMNTSRGQISDLENGAINKRGVQTRYNRDWLELACRSLDVSAGDLIDTNPFREEPKFAAVRRAFPDLDDGALKRLIGFAEVMRDEPERAA